MKLLRKLFEPSSPPKAYTSLAWVNTLDDMDDIAAIELSTLKLSEDFKRNVFQDAMSLKALFTIDEKTHTIVERITTHFIHIENISVELEERISNAVFLYHRQLFLIYCTLIEFAHIEKSSENHHYFLQLFLARGLRNATQMIKWRYYNYQSSPANVWLQISQLYKIAEQHSLLSAKIQAYTDQEPISLSTAYIHACMLGTLESLSLKCQQIELVSKMLTAWTVKVSIDKVYDEKQHLFCVDTASSKPAKRIRNFKPSDACRYWCFDSVNSKIELCLSLIEFNISPKQPLMKELISHKDALTTFESLHAEWSRVDYKRQRRTEERTKAAATVTTAYGFKDICDQIRQHDSIKTLRGDKPYQGDKSFDERLASHSVLKGEPNIIYMDFGTAQSQIIDQSNKGLGLRISKHAHEISLGMLIGVTSKEQRFSTKLGIIRSIKPLVNNELHIGVELLSNIAFCAETENASLKTSKLALNTEQLNTANDYFANTDLGSTINFTNSSFGSDPSNFTCLYLPKEQSFSCQETLIMPKLQYNKNDIFRVNILGENTLIRLTKSYEHQGNWVRATFTALTH